MIDSKVFENLRRIGLTTALAQAALVVSESDDGATLMRVTEVQRESLLLHDGSDEHPARLLPAVRLRLADEGDALAVGDWVLAACNPHGQWWVAARVPPVSQLTRRQHDGRDKLSRAVIVSNVDTALLVMGLDQDFSLRRLERYCSLTRMAGVESVLVLTKADLCAPGVAEERLRQARAVLPAGTVALALDATGVQARVALAPWLLPGRSLVLLGSSGAGKSTLTNSLCASAVAVTGASRHGDGRGRHTTTVRTLHLAPGGACVIDTPGLRTLRLDGDPDEVDAAFEDVARLALQCRFRDCRHAGEPGCAVQDAVPPERLRSYHKLLREARRDSRSLLERQQQLAEWKARGRAGRLRAAGKRG